MVSASPDIHAVLQRGKGTPLGIHGIILIYGKIICYTLEEPWRDNQHDISCVPPGIYTCKRHGWEPDSTAHIKRVWELLNVKGRQGVLIHSGNTLADTLGCILVGSGFNEGGLVDSRIALDKLRAIIGDAETFTLEIRS